MDTRSILPLYVTHRSNRPSDDKYSKTSPSLYFQIARLFTCLCRNRLLPGPSLRFRQKYVAIILLLCFAGICCWTLAALPDQSVTQSSVDVKGIKGVIQGVFNKLPHPIDADDFVLPKPIDAAFQERHGLVPGEDVHVRLDRQRFQQRVANADRAAQIGRPRLAEEQQLIDNRLASEKQQLLHQQLAETVTSADDIVDSRREAIRQMMIFAWDGYKKYAWGSNELRPHSKIAHTGSVFGSHNLGATIIDALDTLYIMGLMDRFDEARKFVEMTFDFSQVRYDVSVFETTIRFVGGFLACFALTKDELFKQKAVHVANLLLPAFDTPTGIPLALINVHSRKAHNYMWAAAGSSILSEFGTLSLEFEYLSVITNNSIYAEKTKKIREVLEEIRRPDGLYYNYVNPRTGKFGSSDVSLGALGDSFYEYLLKSWLVNKTDVESLHMYEDAMDAIKRHLFATSHDGLFYIAEKKRGFIDAKMDHLACFAGGMFALHSVHTQNETAKIFWLDKAQALTHTCHLSYSNTKTKIGPESFRFTADFSAKTINEREKYYILRPEVIESYFYLWRVTKDTKYRDWAWEAAEAIEKYCKDDAGYAGIRNVYDENPSKDDVQQSFFLAETLKYLYLIFSPDSVISLDQWVFNTEAHPLPIRVRQPPTIMNVNEVSNSELTQPTMNNRAHEGD